MEAPRTLEDLKTLEVDNGSIIAVSDNGVGKFAKIKYFELPEKYFENQFSIFMGQTWLSHIFTKERLVAWLSSQPCDKISTIIADIKIKLVPAYGLLEKELYSFQEIRPAYISEVYEDFSAILERIYQELK